MFPRKGGELIPAPHYDPGTDIVGGPKPQVQKYVRAICVAATRLESLVRDLYPSVRDRTATEKLFFARRSSPCRAVYRHSLCNPGTLEGDREWSGIC